MLVRHLPPWHPNGGKRLVKSPKVFSRDSGIAHALLGLASTEDLLGHPVVGGSWEGFGIKNLIAVAPSGTEASFYRSSAGVEIDLTLNLPGDEIWAIEIKRSTSPKVTRRFHIASKGLGVVQRIFVYANRRQVPVKEDIRAMPLNTALRILAAR